jgi:hypothetical protein
MSALSSEKSITTSRRGTHLQVNIPAYSPQATSFAWRRSGTLPNLMCTRRVVHFRTCGAAMSQRGESLVNSCNQGIFQRRGSIVHGQCNEDGDLRRESIKQSDKFRMTSLPKRLIRRKWSSSGEERTRCRRSQERGLRRIRILVSSKLRGYARRKSFV